MGGTHHSFRKRFSRSSGGIFNDTLPWRFICSRFINTAKKLPIMKSTVPLKSRPIFYKNFCCKKWTNESCYIISLGDPTFSMISAVKMNKEKWKCLWLCLGTDLFVDSCLELKLWSLTAKTQYLALITNAQSARELNSRSIFHRWYILHKKQWLWSYFYPPVQFQNVNKYVNNIYKPTFKKIFWTWSSPTEIHNKVLTLAVVYNRTVCL